MRPALVLSLLALVSAARAQPLPPSDVPPALRPWIPWALLGNEQLACPRFNGTDHEPGCVWIGRLQVEVSSRGGRFHQEVELFARDPVPLPGDAEHWPLDVRDGATPVAVVELEGLPVTWLGPGTHVLTGAFSWETLPAALGVPEAASLVELTLGGNRVVHPERDEEGRLFLRRPDRAAGDADRLEVQVQRKLTDGVPLLLTTRIVLDVAGKAREVVLGRALPTGFTPLQLNAPLAARVEPGSHLRVQLRPGKWVFTLLARSDAAVASVARPDPQGPWTEADETWVFEPAPAVRVVTLEGVPSVDPSQTQLPPEWRSLPAFAVRTGEALRLVEQRRGNAEPEPDQLTLSRQLWLDTDGGGWTFQDRLGGELRRSWRLEMPGPAMLGRAAVQGQDQPLTRLGPTSPPGVEVRQGVLAMTADGRIERGGGWLPAVAWTHDFTSVGGVAHLPPGWSLLAATGVDEVKGTWVQRWSLLDLFLVLVLALATGRLFGWRVGALALVALVLSFPEEGAPRWAWLLVLAAEGLTRVVPEGRLRAIARALRVAAFGVLALVLVAFALAHLRERFYPALGQPGIGELEEGILAPEQERDALARMGVAVQQTAPEVLEAPAAAPPPPEKKAKEAAKVLKREAGGAEAVSDLTSGVEGGVARGVAVGKGVAAIRGKVVSPSSVAVPRPSATQSQIDRNAVVQTGPGVPRWTWRTVPLRWSGPVQQGQSMHLWLLSPGDNVFLGLARVALLAWLGLLLLVRGGMWRPPGLRRGGAAAAAAAALFLGVPTASAEEQPTDERLTQLRDKLLQAPRCAPSCASAARGLLEVDPGGLRLRVELQATVQVAVPLAGGGEGWRPEQVLLDGKPAVALTQVEGVSWLVLKPGIHTLLLAGALPRRDSVQLPLGLPPRSLSVQARGWKVDGVREDGRPEPTLQLSRIERSGGGEALRPGALPAFARVTRSVQLGLTWEVETTVERLSPSESAVVLDVPLLPGEAVLTADLEVKNGTVAVNLPPSTASVSWHSTLEQRPTVSLTAPATTSWIEHWILDAGPMWHVQLAGIAPVHPRGPADSHLPTWLPWPGESISIQVSRPEGVGGGTLTLDGGKEEVRPGLRATEVGLDLSFRTSRGGQHAVVLPPGIELLGVAVNGQSQPVRLESGRLLVTLTPPASRVSVRWREPRGISAAFRPSAVDAGASGANVDVVISVPAQRWVLWLAGPTFGPAVLFWSVLLVTVGIAVMLARVPHSPVRVGAWMLLGVGLTQVSVPAAALVVLWLLAIGWREAYGARVRPWWVFDLMQLALVVTTGIAFLVLFEAVRRGLLGQPDMQIAGNGSTLANLRWTADRVPGALPRPLIVSLPLLVYRLAMLAWALWLATALLAWVRLGWHALATGGLWRPHPPKVVTGPAPGPPAAPG
ncbi:MAG TPA: hypothetical protein VMH40_17185 [Myxococcaceae bacterium]|nr:hypothetical protein [Myxococcaceae bacterium]